MPGVFGTSEYESKLDKRIRGFGKIVREIVMFD
jgi:hypothetical protein